MLDIDYFKKAYGSDPELIKVILKELSIQMLEVITNYPEWSKTRKTDLLCEHAHKIKSSLGYMGLDDQAQLFEAIEKESKSKIVPQDDIEEAIRLAEYLVSEIKKL